MSENDIKNLWNNGDKKEWDDALKKYWDISSVKRHEQLEKEMDNIHSYDNLKRIREMSGEEFYSFLYDKYFVWKYTAKNRLTTTQKQLETQNRNDLYLIKKSLFYIYDNIPDDIELLLINILRIKGLGVAGGSGLLSILFPNLFGTVDQFLIDSLCDISSSLDEATASYICKIEKNNIKLKEGVFLEKILIEKSKELNNMFSVNDWSPRKIDMVLWAYRSNSNK